MTASKHRRGPVAAVVAVASLAGSLAITLGPARPASAGSGYLNDTSTTPVTWVDSQNRQVMVVSNDYQTLQVVRDTPVGDPDLTWGQNGSRQLVYDLPDGAAKTSGVMAADDAGIVTLVHTGADCSASPCDVWLQRIDGTTADAVAPPVSVTGTLGPWRGLDDGSLLMRTPGDHLRWVAANGTSRGDLALTAAQVADADVDAAGRLLVIAADGTLTRTPANAASADLTLATGCDQSQHPAAVGASAVAAGFAVACDPGAGDGVRTTMYADEGAVDWTAASTAPNAPVGFATEVTVTATKTAWVGVRNPTVDSSEPTVGLISASPATSAGWGPRVDLRKTGQPSYFVLGPLADYGGGVVQMRPVTDTGEVAVADLRVCCQYPSHTAANYAAYSSVVPYRKGPPTCSAAPVNLQAPSTGTLEVRFTACPESIDPARKPTGYRVDLVVDGVTTTKAVPSQGSTANPTTTFTGIANGKVANVTVTPFNPQGDTTAYPPATEGTVYPFDGAADFVWYDAQTLGWTYLNASGVASYYYGVRGGSLTPAAFMKKMLTEGTARRSVEPVYRIYRAAFLRDADPSGLRYWVGKHRSGVRIAVIAENFTRSSEFKRRYGSLTNRQFVERIYENVLGRAGDPAGIAFWTNRLDAKKATRGGMLASFSESSEFVRKTLGRAQVTTTVFLMLDRTPTDAEMTTWSSNPDVYGTMPEAILATEAYAEHIRNRH